MKEARFDRYKKFNNLNAEGSKSESPPLDSLI